MWGPEAKKAKLYIAFVTFDSASRKGGSRTKIDGGINHAVRRMGNCECSWDDDCE